MSRPTRSWREPVLAALGGIAATAVDGTTLGLLLALSLPVALAAWTGTIAGAVVSFYWSRGIAFRDKAPISAGKLTRFAIVVFVCSIVTATAMHITVDTFGWSVVVAKTVCAVAIFFAWTYPAQKRWVFTAGSRAGAAT